MNGIKIKEIHAPLPKNEDLVHGATVLFGSYFQEDEIHKTPIEWIVLESNDGVALLISKKALMVSGYCDSKKVYEDLKYLEYSHSKARHICEFDFYEVAFSDEEKECILSKAVREAGHGLLRKDKVFLLSEREVRLFLPNEEQRKCEPTKFAKKNGARMGWSGNEAYTSWWILPECEEMCGHMVSAKGIPYEKGEIYPKAVFHNGDIQFHGRNIGHSDFTIRPCIMIKASDSFKYKKYNLDYIKSFTGKERTYAVGERYVYHDSVMNEYRLVVQLDETREYFLSVFIREDGSFENYSLDIERASDSHYEFREEDKIREKLYAKGDEGQYLDEIFIRYISQYGGDKLPSLILPYVTAQFHF